MFWFCLRIILSGLLLAAQIQDASASAQQDSPLLRLLLLRPDAQPAQAAKTAGVDDMAVPALTSPDARSVTAHFIGRPINDALLNEIRNSLTAYYARLGRPFVDIAIPAQDVASGLLRVNVIETKRGRLTVQGNRWFGSRQYIDAISVPPDGPIDIPSLTADTEWLNRNERRHVSISLRPTDDPTVDDLAINAEDHLPLVVTLAGDNTGTEETGLYRAGFSVDWSNAFWRGDDLSYGFLASPGSLRLIQNALTYTTYLPWRDTITLSALIEDTRGFPTQNTSSTSGRAETVSWRYGLALPSTSILSQRIDFGYDFKSTNTNIFNGGSTIFASTLELDQFSLSYVARRVDSLGSAGLTATLVGSPGYITPRNTTAALSAEEPGTTATYLYGRVVIDRVTELPGEAAWSARLTAQYSSDNLLASEQLEFGGAQSIRGFADLGALRDEGAVMEHELRLAPVKPGFPQSLSETLTVTPFVFVDAGAGRNHLDMPDARHSWIEMLSVGPGCNWQFTPSAALRFSWGFPLVRNGHTGPVLGPQFGTQISF